MQQILTLCTFTIYGLKYCISRAGHATTWLRQCYHVLRLKYCISTAGHATTWPRQCYHVLRPKNIVDYCIMYIFVATAPFRHQDREIFSDFLVSESRLRFRVVIVEKLKQCRVPSSEFLSTAIYLYSYPFYSCSKITALVKKREISLS